MLIERLDLCVNSVSLCNLKKYLRLRIFAIICLFVTVQIYFIHIGEFNFSAPKISIFQLNKPLEPSKVYEIIECRRSATVVVSTTLCVHSREKDIHVSGSILGSGVWELHIISQFNDYLKQNPDWLVIDLGAQIGQYSLFAAKMGHKVVSIEPFFENIIRIHKAAYLEKTHDKIVLITNAVSNKRNEIKLLEANAENIGGQSMMQHKNKTFVKDEKNKYLVETILFDDIVPYLPYKNATSKEKFKKAILKIDIEGFEPYAFECANHLFNTLDIRVVFMEWGNNKGKNNDEVSGMLDFFYKQNYKAYDNNILLTRRQWTNWPWDIIWRKD